MKARASSFVLALAAVSLSCAPRGPVSATKPAPKRASRSFPAAERLTEIAEKPVPALGPVELIADTDTWTLAGPLPDSVSAVRRKGTGPWEKSFAEAVARERKVRATEPMHCVARELGRYELAKSGRPPQDLQRFILGRCGASAEDLGTISTVEEIPDGLSDAEAAESVRDLIEQTVAGLASTGQELDIGLSVEREAGRAIILFAASERAADLDPIPMAVSNGKVTVKGTLRVPAASVQASVNRGRFGSEDCTPDDRVFLPAFSFSCAVDVTDSLARIEVSSFPPDRILGHSIAGIMVAPSGQKLTSTYQRLVPDSQMNSTSALTDRFLAALNGVRREAGLSEMKVAAAQTEIAHRVTPHFFAAQGLRSKDAQEKLVDTIALGMLAGWSVEGTVHDGSLASDWTSDSGDPARLVASMLESPSSRSVLLDAEADVIAIGTAQQPERRALGALVTVYRLFEPVPPETRARKVLARMDALRAENGRPPTVPIKNLAAEVDAAIKAVEVDHVHPRSALDRLLGAALAKNRAGMRGFVIEAHALDDFRLPLDYVDAASLPIAVAVAYHRPEGEPWGRWVIMVAAYASEPA